MPHIKINGCNLYYEEHGNPNAKETLVFSHGLLWSGKMFHKQVDHFTNRFRIITYDHRGQGQSEVTPGGYDMDDVYKDAVSLIETLKLGAVHFVGLSMGGFVGMRLAARRPDLVKSLVLMETSAQHEPNKVKYSLLVGVVKLFGVKSVTGPVMNIMFGDKFLKDKGRTEERNYWVHQLQNNPKAITHAVNGVVFRKGVVSELTHITCPVLVIVGNQDKATVPAKAECIHRHVPQSLLKYIDGAGHTSCIEEPLMVNGYMEEFYNSLNV